VTFRIRATAALIVALVALAVSLPARAAAGPSARAATGAPPRLAVNAAALTELSTGQLLYKNRAFSRLPIASTTKLMTALITLEHVPHLSRAFTQNNFSASSADSQIGLVPGERMSVHDLLLALLLPSADDAAEDLAYNVGHHSVARFIGMMNARARQLGLTQTHYSTPSGLDTPGNYSTATDLLTLSGYLLRTQPWFGRAVALPHALLKTGSHPRYVVNRNDLVGRYSWVRGVKTGHTSGAGYVLVGAGARRGMELLSVVMGTSSEYERDANTLRLLDWGLGTFRIATPVTAGQVIARPTVKDRPGVHAVVIAAKSVVKILPRSPGLSWQVTVPKQLAGPLARHAVVGTLTVWQGRQRVATVSLLLNQRLPAVSPLTRAARFLTRPFTLVLLAVLFVVAFASAGVWRSRTRERGAAGPKAA
jgi:serine-type D-Ala-D-Ala carboxypeptidase (penicillin-binding protein 5/6)